jgi:hypothetical protein
MESFSPEAAIVSAAVALHEHNAPFDRSQLFASDDFSHFIFYGKNKRSFHTSIKQEWSIANYYSADCAHYEKELTPLGRPVHRLSSETVGNYSLIKLACGIPSLRCTPA